MVDQEAKDYEYYLKRTDFTKRQSVNGEKFGDCVRSERAKKNKIK